MTASLLRLPPAVADFFWALPGIAERAPLLALAHDGCQLQGALFRLSGQTLQLQALGSSCATAFSVALAEVLTQIGSRPRRAVLASASVTSALLELPVAADEAKPATEMLPLVKWELEPLMAEQVGLWSLGALLQARGYLSAEEREAISVELAQRRLEGSGRALRFGELALEMGKVRREQVEECLARQNQLQSIDDQVLCAWAGRGTPIEGGRSRWLCTAMGLSIQGRWVEACRHHGLTLEAIYPLAGTLATVGDGPRLLIEAHASHVLVSRVHQGLMQAMSCRALNGQPAAPQVHAMLADLLEPDDQQLALLATHLPGAPLAQSLSETLGRPVLPLADGDSALSLQPVLQACAQARLLRKAPGLPALPGSEPLAPPLQRPQTWAALGLMALLGISALYESAAWWRMHQAQAELNVLASLKQRREDEKSRDQQALSETQGLRLRIADLRRQQDEVQAELDFYQSELGGRAGFVAAAIHSLAQTIGPEVVIEQLRESQWFELSVKAWALTQSAGYRFGKDLAQALTQWRFEVRDIQIQAETGRSGAPGYGVQFRLVRRQAGPPADHRETAGQHKAAHPEARL